ncbi:COG1361 S-layer family protein [uncultured Methanolobus sp.]|uniref:COG1361 S-layer family protein n=1 Tax=uncultured Methanolobus sp. TaxID=218300 RepID=UPI0037479AE5
MRTDKLDILAAEVSPQPVRPGEELLVKVSVANYDDTTTTNIILDVENQFPLILRFSEKEYGVKSISNNSFRIDRISSNGNVEINYNFLIDPKARTGTYHVTFRLSDGNDIFVTRTISIKVEGTPAIALMNSSFSQSGISPGDSFFLNTTVASVGSGNAKNIRITLLLDDVPSLVAVKDNTAFIHTLDAGEEEQITFELSLGKDAEITSYNIPVSIIAVDDTENLDISSVETIGFDAKGRAKLDIANIKNDPTMPEKGKELTQMIRIENVGEGEARSVKVSILDLDVSGTKEAFIGKLDANDDAPATFSFIPRKSGDQEYTALIEYEDDFGKHSIEHKLTMGVKGSSPYQILLGIIVLSVVIFGAFSLKKRFKKETEE